MKRSLLIAVLFTIIAIPARSNEGLWLPIWLESLNEYEMKFMGMKLSASDIYDPDTVSVSDAIVSFGGFCTGEIISPDGLVLTNHHCGYDAIQSLSLGGTDHLGNGYWAQNNGEELPVEGLFVRILKRMEDVTDQVLDSTTLSLDGADRSRRIRERIKEIEEEAKGDSHYVTDVKGYFENAEYYLLIYEQFDDIRLVGAPPESIGSFGGDTDNWTWPRHTGDFSLFRIYTDTTGAPAGYAESNIPYKPEHHLPVSMSGVKKGDFTLSLGYPGTTQRYLSSFGINEAINQVNPAIVKIRGKKLEVMKRRMDEDPQVYIKYAKQYALTSNYYKYFIGQTKSLKRMGVEQKRKDEEQKFREWANSAPDTKELYGTAVDDLERLFNEKKEFNLQRYYVSEAIITGPTPFTLSYYSIRKLNEKLTSGASDEEIKSIAESARERGNGYFDEWDDEIEKEMMAAMLKMYHEDLDGSQVPEFLMKAYKDNNGDMTAYVEKVFERSVLTSRDRLNKFLDKPSAKQLSKDPVFNMYNEIYSQYAEKTRKEIMRLRTEIGDAERKYLEGSRRMYMRKRFYPDANSTLRVVYGSVEDYYPRDGVYYNWKTTGEGILEKMDNSDPEFTVPEQLETLIRSREFGVYGENDTLPVCFIHTNDQTGGSSGSPVMNGNGELIGISFDGNWESMSGDIAYDPRYKRSIATDIRYVLFIIDKFAGAGHLIEEMTIVKEETSASVTESSAP